MNLFKLVATVGMDTSEYDRKTDQVVESGHKMAGKLGSAVKGAAKVAAAGITAATTAVGAFATVATKSFAEYEQLAGGVETLFKNSANKVKGYAAEAYKTAGLSGNQYMETVTSFSASLIQSLGGDTEAAADVANQAIIDMSDNANKMGTDISMIQNAYQGFAKQNYTMLDNLKLGYGGTKTEMQRLIDDANKVKEANGDMADLSIDSFADVTEAIHIMQDEMGIAGATADEAATTIEGSINAAKGAWQNFVTGFGRDDADMVKLTSDLVEAVGTAASNIVPRVGKILEGLKDVGVQMAPKIAEGISQAVEKAPQFLQAGMDVLGALGRALLDQSDVLLDSAFSLLNTILDGLNAHPGVIFDSMAELLTTFAEKLQENGPTLFAKAKTLLMGEDGNGGLIGSFVDNAPEMIVAATEIIAELASGLLEVLPDLLAKIPQAVEDIANGFASEENLERMSAAGSKLWGALLNSIPGIKDIADMINWFKLLIDDPGAALGGAWENIKGFMSNPVGYASDLFNRGIGPESSPSASAIPAPAPTPVPGLPSTGWHPPYKKTRVDGSHADGLDYVPFDGYIAELHQGERVLTAEEARSEGTVVNATININGGDFGDRRELAEYLAETLQSLTDRRAAARG